MYSIYTCTTEAEDLGPPIMRNVAATVKEQTIFTRFCRSKNQSEARDNLTPRPWNQKPGERSRTFYALTWCQSAGRQSRISAWIRIRCWRQTVCTGRQQQQINAVHLVLKPKLGRKPNSKASINETENTTNAHCPSDLIALYVQTSTVPTHDSIRAALLAFLNMMHSYRFSLACVQNKQCSCSGFLFLLFRVISILSIRTCSWLHCAMSLIHETKRYKDTEW